MLAVNSRVPYSACRIPVTNFILGCPPLVLKRRTGTRNALRFDRNLLRSLPAIKAWIVLAAVLTSCSLPTAAEIPSARPQIQGGNLRVEFDNRLRSRVVALFDNQEKVLGPFTASETVTTSRQSLDRIRPHLAEAGAHKRHFRRRKAAHHRRKGGCAQKIGLRHRIRQLPHHGVFRCPVHQHGKHRARGQELDEQRLHDQRATRGGVSRLSGLTRVAPTRNAPTGSYRCTQIFSRRIIRA